MAWRSMAMRSDAHAEGEAAVLVRVDAAVAQHLRVHHARAHDLQAAGELAGAAARAAADQAVDRQVHARLHVGEIVAAEAHLAAPRRTGRGRARPACP